MRGVSLSRLALYRKHRPADFSEVAGQEHITKTLESAISKGMAAHAYLFTGPRGTGKTTVARIVARRLNDLPADTDLAGELDIIEIDGASNRGIDEIRSLRERVAVAPTRLKYKVYIIDEVHMLTREAFNALLKTLEEPPAHVVFVFATTEVHKLPETIISRTQRFDFRPIATAPLQAQLKQIAGSEGIKIDDSAVELIAALSRGGFRDAISLLDQLSTSQANITVELVRQFTGLQDPSALKDLIQKSLEGKAGKVLEGLRALFADGADPVIMTGQLLDIIQAELIESKNTQRLLALAERLHTAQSTYRYSSLPELALQVAMASDGKSIKEKGESEGPKIEDRRQKTEVKPEAKPLNSNPPEADENLKSTESELKAESPAPTVAPADVESNTIKALSIIKHHNNSLYAVLRGSELSVAGSQVNIVCRFSFHRDRMNEARNRELIAKAFSKVFGQTMQVNLEIEKPSAKPEVNAETELVSSAMAILGGELVEEGN